MNIELGGWGKGGNLSASWLPTQLLEKALFICRCVSQRFSLFSFSEVLGAVGTAPLLASRGHLGRAVWSRPLGDPYVGEALGQV